MRPIECLREQDVLDAIASGRWPDRDADLRAHVAVCDLCRDLADVVAALTCEQQVSVDELAALPSADLVWWRAQIRARTEAARAASRPIAVVQALGVACLVGVVVGLAGHAEWGLPLWARWFADAAAVLSTAAGTDAVGLALRGGLLTVGVWLVLAPVAVYLATDE